MAPLRYTAKIDPFLSLDCAQFCHLATMMQGVVETASRQGPLLGGRARPPVLCRRHSRTLTPLHQGRYSMML